MLDIPKIYRIRPSLVNACVERLTRDETVVVETQRLKHLIQTAYDLSQRDSGLVAWPSAEVYVWEEWLRKLWAQIVEQNWDLDRPLLTHQQSQQLWENVIRSDVGKNSDYEFLLWHITATANQAQTAYGLMRVYEIETSDFPNDVSEDIRHFMQWLKQYLAAVKKRKWIDLQTLPSLVCENAGYISAEQAAPVIFAGFDSWPPQNRRTVESLKLHGMKVEVLGDTEPARSKSSHNFFFENIDDEIRACAQWARAVIEANPKVHKVGIVSPDLRRVHQRLYRVFSSCLNPDSVLDHRESWNMSFHMTLGTDLSSTPLVIDALNLIELIRPEVGISVMCEVLRSDRIKGWENELSERSLLAHAVFSLGSSHVSIDNVLTLIDRSANIECPVLAEAFQSAQKMRSNMPATASFAYWGQFFMDWMKNFQSISRKDRKFGIEEAQIHRSWCHAVESLAGISLVTRDVSADVAAAKLARIVSRINTQPRAIHSPIQVGEMVSMAGQSFTHLWIMGMDNSSLPGTPNPNPFIPVELQISREIPDSSSEDLVERMNLRFDRLIGAADSVVLSYSQTDGSEVFGASNLIQNPQKYEESERFAFPDYKELLTEHFKFCEEYSDWEARPISQAELENFSGSSAALQHQSNCYFRAFAHARLKAEPIGAPEIGITALLHGLLAHQVVEELYENIHTPADINNNYEDLARRIKEIASHAVNSENRKRIKPIRKELIETEIKLLIDIVDEWLSVDSQIPDNQKIWELELAQTFEIEGLPVRLRIDRVDLQLQPNGDSQFIVIDYKTSNSYKARHSTGPRPRELQLLLYACALEDNYEHRVREIAYAYLKGGCAGTDSLEIIDYFSKPEPEWKARVRAIARDFVEGKAFVEPQKFACQYCELDSLCRIDAHQKK